MSERMKTHRTDKQSHEMYKIIIEMPNKKKHSSYIRKPALKKLEAFLEKYSEQETTDWDKIASERIIKYQKSGLALRGARIREGLTQKELAKKTGISQENLSRMENGKRAIGENVAKKLAKALKVDIRLLMLN